MAEITISKGVIHRDSDGAFFEFPETGELMSWSDGCNPSFFPDGAQVILTEVSERYDDPDFPGEECWQTLSLDLSYE